MNEGYIDSVFLDPGQIVRFQVRAGKTVALSTIKRICRLLKIKPEGELNSYGDRELSVHDTTFIPHYSYQTGNLDCYLVRYKWDKGKIE